ncbi:unnamed protein product [Parnassius apollo]|uniref:(apollo) hypothetical protein n=1 Tax=Parnassius apollo TaxID=110799 RepID=A0A8S3X5N1_PARAO|nr:unnamed protein product [Parnassius apollo]
MACKSQRPPAHDISEPGAGTSQLLQIPVLMDIPKLVAGTSQPLQTPAHADLQQQKDSDVVGRNEKSDPEKVAEVKRKDLERYHARKKLVADMNAREHRIMKRKWQQANKKRREKKQMLENVPLDTPALSPIPENPQIRPHSATPTLSEASSARGRKKVKRDRSKMYRDNIK